MVNNLQALLPVKQIGEESFFQHQVELFWLDYQKSDINRMREKWDGRDSFKVYYSHGDILDPSKPGFFEISLTKNLQKTIGQRFDALLFEFKDLQLDNKESRKRMYSDILIELENVEKKISKLKLPGEYRSIVARAFDQHVKLLRKRDSNNNTSKRRKTWKFIYRPEVIKEEQRFDDDGRFKDFFQRLKEEEFISANTKIIHLKQLFSNEVPSQKIRWTKEGPSELFTLIKMLEERNFISTYRKWTAVRESFITNFPMTNLHSVTPVTDTKNLMKISEIIDELVI